jgi:hypothetical protein
MVRAWILLALFTLTGGCGGGLHTHVRESASGMYSNVSFRVYNTPKGTADILKGVLESLHAQKVSYVKLYDGGYRFYYRSIECRTSLDCEEFTVTIKPDGTGSKRLNQSNVSITGLYGELNRETVRTIYYELSKFTRTSNLFSLEGQSEKERLVYEITFSADARPAEVISWTYNILQEMKLRRDFIHIRKLGNVFYRLTYRDDECEAHKGRYSGIRKLLKLDEIRCPGFIMDAGLKGSSTMVQIYASDRYLPFQTVNTIYLRLSDIVRTANYTEDF